ncbi:MAG: hypothetical protein KDJ29_14760 [Hyphomicrobiales bacterium]|nr:hypothetical protein [Hyphomicrobiales bacterium]
MNTIARTFAAAAVLAVSAFAASQPASAMVIRNCTGDVVRVNFYNNNDALRVVPLAGLKIGPGNGVRYNIPSGSGFIKVFRAQVIDKLMFERGGLPNGGNFLVTRGYGFSSGMQCR